MTAEERDQLAMAIGQLARASKILSDLLAGAELSKLLAAGESELRRRQEIEKLEDTYQRRHRTDYQRRPPRPTFDR